MRSVGPIPLRVTYDVSLPLYLSKVSAGFPSPADDWIEKSLDLNEFLIERPAATFILRVSGDSMSPTLEDGDLLIVDRALQAKQGMIVIAVWEGDLTVKRLGNRCLLPDNSTHTPITIADGQQLTIWGVVRHSIRSLV